MTINGIAILIGMAFAAFVGIVCYWWGTSNERDRWERMIRRNGGAL